MKVPEYLPLPDAADKVMALNSVSGDFLPPLCCCPPSARCSACKGLAVGTVRAPCRLCKDAPGYRSAALGQQLPRGASQSPGVGVGTGAFSPPPLLFLLGVGGGWEGTDGGRTVPSRSKSRERRCAGRSGQQTSLPPAFLTGWDRSRLDGALGWLALSLDPAAAHRRRVHSPCPPSSPPVHLLPGSERI